MGLGCCLNVVWCALGGLGWFGVFWSGLGCFHGPEKHCCNLPKFQTQTPSLRKFHQKGANGIANSENLDQTANRSSLIWVCTVCPDLSVLKLIG